MDKVLIVTVGGSIEPIFTSITQNKPDFTYFLCSDDTQTPKNKGSYIMVNEGKDGEKPIALRTGLASSEYEIIKIKEIDNLNHCYVTAAGIIQRVRLEYPGSQLIIDYTGGTKSMSAGLAAAAMDDGRCLLSVVKGVRSDLVKVRDGTQRVSKYSADLYIYKRFKLIKELFSKYDYSGCISLILELTDFELPKDIEPEIQAYEVISKGLDAWDKFDHDKAYSFLESYAAYIKDHFGFFINVRRDKESYESEEELTRKVGYNIVFDLLLNAQRRAFRGQYDDGVARMYRALEMLGQITLLNNSPSLKSGDIQVELLPESIRDKYEAMRNTRSGKIEIGLWANFELIKDLKGPISEVIAIYRNQLINETKKRNTSILAHGITPLSKKDYEDMYEPVQLLINEVGEILKLKDRYNEEIQFPREIIFN
ncbi:CRISPR-associated protein, TIGR02710 family [Desulfofarcimen acetoxidans DSM 771]|uniref:CRISPR-associated protein, TIGR02710 family n=1 Tax=Desulfofarcimen acetoxidans (strain ATCC 49208 / DSM 771 / KCTC 5769 / VKM B-1644 / 5575) TaxID=485916 RepID=C8W2P1_DESAS|nr:TIGR02710 family CRISPR-associated CARF protein [Desulfofarcimen acetoxidans]ACV63725.1 CRISPR-associated protein, TIGR02710 family [Desulfofarcimen acetoxidans DSM 771]